jgi:hypothetical protein
MARESTESCSWCGRAIERDDGWRAEEVPGARKAAFCRLEHVVPWHIQGAHWEPGELEEPSGLSNARGEREALTPSGLDSCSHCGEPLGDVRVLLVRHRGEHRVPDAFCSVDHLADWARSGGRWG